MKKTLVAATVLAAAIAVAPVAISGSSVFAANPEQVIEYANNTLLTNPNADVPVYNDKGMTTDEVLSPSTNAIFTNITTINGQSFYKLATGGYVLAGDVLIIREVKNNAVSVTAKSNGAIVSDIAKSSSLGKVETIPAGSSWKVLGKYSVNGLEYYQIGAKKFVKASDVYTAKTIAEKETATATNKYRAVGTVEYAPGYGIQVWTKAHKFAYNEDGSLKKLQHGTSWKVFGDTTINGKMFYHLGGNQWIDAAYITLK